ncbi:MAG: hypothetical protein HUN05_05720 [Desulfobacter sp.]|nr:MAG: hypothetical protein HUN05_05720 [Desulfobacter sp.]
MNLFGSKKTISIRFTVLGLFVLMTAATAGIILGIEYFFSSRLANKTAEKNFHALAENISQKIVSRDRQTSELVDMLRHYQTLSTPPKPGTRHPAMPVLANAMEQNPNLYAIQVGYDTGGYYEIINLESSPDIRQVYGADPKDRWLIIKIIPGKGPLKKELEFLDDRYFQRHSSKIATTYDPRKRPWYTHAFDSSQMEKSTPYFFANLKSPGVTFAGRIKQTGHVVAADMTRKAVLSFFSSQKFLPSCEIFVFKPNGEITFSSDSKTDDLSMPLPRLIPLSPEEKAFIKTHP